MSDTNAGKSDFTRQKYGSYGTAMKDLILADVGFALAGTDVLGLKPFAFLNSWATGLVNDAQSALTTANDAQTHAAAISTGIQNGYSGQSSSGSDMGVYSTLSSIANAIKAGYQEQTFVSSGNWTVPQSYTEVVVIAIGSGQNGQNGASGSSSQAAAGGLGGGYIVQNFRPSDISGSTVSVTVGTGGSASSFGSLLVTTPGQGALASQFGYTPTNSIPGSGGSGGWFIDGSPKQSFFCTSGQSTPLAAGGSAGQLHTGGANGGSGGNGGGVNTSVDTKCGGAGGGGGESGTENVIGIAYAGGNGGAGGYPGGGGGGGGSKSDGTGTGGPGNGGPGANGVVFVFWK